jgi:release factor glutamine methyltransferase
MMKKMPVPELINTIERQLLPKFHDATLCTQYAWWLLEYVTHKPELSLIGQSNFRWSEQDQKKLDDALAQLITHDMPLSYLLGSIPFCGLDIISKPPVLIPRPETEEWCANLIDQLQPLRDESLWILDLCTGSGCIALTLADALPKAKVYGTDISDIALALANENKSHNHIANVQFLRSDCFDQIPKEFKFDLIVGNPPYIPESQWQALENSVRNWEDKNALIAPDNGLALIKRIIDEAPLYIKPNELMKKRDIPQLVLEIDSTQANAVADYLALRQYNEVTIKKDLENKDRVATGRIDDVAICQT